jgi:hypothetical protein
VTDRLTLDPEHDLDLTGAARSYDVPAGDADAVLRRAHRRSTRRHRAVAVLSVAALVAAGSVSVDLLDGEESTSVASGGGVARGNVGVTWRAVAPETALGFASDTGSAAPLYAISTAPGQADVNAPAGRRVVWRSDDGVEWTSLSSLGTDLYASDLSSRDDRIYAVGTGPATAAAGGRSVSPLLVGWSDDGARTWQKARLPVDLEAIAARSTRSIVRSTAVAAGPAGTLAVGVLDASLDVRASLPAGVTAPDGWVLTETGVDLLGPERKGVCPAGSSPPEKTADMPADPSGEVFPVWCTTGDDDRMPLMVSPQDARGVTASYTWEQLGVDGDLLVAVRRQPVAFLAPPGSDRFERVDVPAVPGVQGPVLLEVSDTGFDLVTTTADKPGRPSMVVLESPDGRSWRAAEGISGSWAAAAGRVGGVATVVAQGETGAVVVRADGAGGWVTTPLGEVLGTGPEAQVSLVSAGVGPFGVVAAVVVAEKGFERGPIAAQVVVSRDGRTWDAVAVEDLVDEPVRNVVRASVVGDRAVVAVSVGAEGPGRYRQVAMVGTPS